MPKMNTGFKEKISEQLRTLIKEKYGTIEQFCYGNDFSKGTISEILSNKKLPRLDTLARITNCLGVKLSDFFKKIKE